MATWLQKITSSVVAKSKTDNVPMIRSNQLPAVPGQPVIEAAPVLPAASIIYGVAASALFVFGLYFLFTGRWFTGLLICIVGACFVGFALQFMKR